MEHAQSISPEAAYPREKEAKHAERKAVPAKKRLGKRELMYGSGDKAAMMSGQGSRDPGTWGQAGARGWLLLASGVQMGPASLP